AGGRAGRGRAGGRAPARLGLRGALGRPEPEGPDGVPASGVRGQAGPAHVRCRVGAHPVAHRRRRHARAPRPARRLPRGRAPPLRVGGGGGGRPGVRRPGAGGRRGAGRNQPEPDAGNLLGRLSDRSMSAAPARSTESWVRLLSLLGTLLVWQAAAVLVHRPFLPTPAVVLASM